MNPRELFQAGRLTEAVQALSVELRDHPTDTKRRTFLFELLCFAGDYERAERHLQVLGQGSAEAELGTLLYRGALQAERTRQQMFAQSELPPAPAEVSIAGTLNGTAFSALSDADPRIGARLEVFAAGRYLLLPLMHVSSVRIEAPKRLRDLLWAPALVRTGPGLKDMELGEVLAPALSPASWRHANEDVRLGRATEWEADEAGNEIPFGQKMLLVDGEEFPLLEVRSLEITAQQAAVV